jgi:hypothetical protein
MARWRDEGLAAVLAVLVAAPLLAGRCYLSDALLYALPMFGVVQHAVQAHRLVAWAPELFAGYNALGAGQSGLCYPPHWLMLSLFNLMTAFRLSYVLHYWLLARGLLGFARRLGFSTLGALTVAAGGALGGAVAGHVMHFNVIIGLAWTAIILWLTAIVAAEPEPGYAPALLAAAVGLSALQSHPQYVVTAFLVSLALLPWLRAEAVSWRRLGARVLLAWAGGLVLASAQVVPLLEYARVFPRPHPGGQFSWITQYNFEPRDALRFFVPEAFGSLRRGGVLDLAAFWENRAFTGLTFLALAIAQVCRRPRDRGTRAAVALTVVAALLAVGHYNPLWHVLCYIPPFNLVRIPGRFLWACQLGVALLAGGGLTALAAGRLPRRAAWCGALTVAGGVLAALAASLATGHARAPGLLGWLMAALGVGTALSLPFLSGRRAALGVACVGLIELTVSFHTFAETRPARWFDPPPFAAVIGADPNPRVFVLDGAVPEIEPERARDQLEPNFGLLYGVSYLQGWEALPPTAHLGIEHLLARDAEDHPPAFKTLLDRYSVRWVITAHERDNLGLELVRRDGALCLYRNPEARPSAYAVDARLRDDFGVRTPLEGGARIEPVEVRRHDPEHWEVHTHFDRPMAVVVSQSLYPGWMAFVDGRSSLAEGAEELLMSAFVPAGEHDVEFVFNNTAIWQGLYVSRVALALWLLWLLLVARRLVTKRAAASTAPAPAA